MVHIVGAWQAAHAMEGEIDKFFDSGLKAWVSLASRTRYASMECDNAYLHATHARELSSDLL